MLTIHTAKEYKDFGKNIKSTELFETCKSVIDTANAIDNLIEKINSDEDFKIVTLSKFVLTRIGMLISKRYIKCSNINIKFYNGKKDITEYSYNKEGGINGLNLSVYSPKVKPYNFKK